MNIYYTRRSADDHYAIASPERATLHTKHTNGQLNTKREQYKCICNQFYLTQQSNQYQKEKKIKQTNERTKNEARKNTVLFSIKLIAQCSFRMQRIIDCFGLFFFLFCFHNFVGICVALTQFCVAVEQHTEAKKKTN